jgi:hypothetical protein
MAIIDAGDSDILNEWLSLYSWENESKMGSKPLIKSIILSLNYFNCHQPVFL